MLMKGARVALRVPFFSSRMLSWSENCKEEVSVMKHQTEEEASAMNRFRGKSQTRDKWQRVACGGKWKKDGRERDLPSERIKKENVSGYSVWGKCVCETCALRKRQPVIYGGSMGV